MKARLGDGSVFLEGLEYFVGKAGTATPTAWGDKKSHAGPGKRSYLDVWDVLPAPKLAQLKFAAAAVDVEFIDRHGINVMAALVVPGLAPGKVSLKAADFANGTVTLVKVSPTSDKELIEQINAAPKVLARLIELGASARIVKDMLIVVEAALYRRFADGAANQAAVIVNGVMVRADREPGRDRSSEIHIAPGVALAYGLAEPTWSTAQDKNETRVVGLCDDPLVCSPARSPSTTAHIPSLQLAPPFAAATKRAIPSSHAIARA